MEGEAGAFIKRDKLGDRAVDRGWNSGFAEDVRNLLAATERIADENRRRARRSPGFSPASNRHFRLNKLNPH